jgi:hypothetical protein
LTLRSFRRLCAICAIIDVAVHLPVKLAAAKRPVRRCFMRLSCLVVVVLLVVTSSVFAQHSSAGSSSSFSGGGSHGGSVGSSSGSYSSSAHSSGASAPHGSAAQLAHSTQSGLNIRQAALKPNATATGTQAEKRGFFSHLRHPFRTTAPTLETSSRLPVCKKEPCTLPICPRGQSLNGNGVCAATNLGTLSCQAGNYWGNGACAALLPDDCRGLAWVLNRLALIQDEQARQAKREILQREYARCHSLQSLFSPYWSRNSSLNSLAGFP